MYKPSHPAHITLPIFIYILHVCARIIRRKSGLVLLQKKYPGVTLAVCRIESLAYTFQSKKPPYNKKNNKSTHSVLSYHKPNNQVFLPYCVKKA